MRKVVTDMSGIEAMRWIAGAWAARCWHADKGKARFIAASKCLCISSQYTSFLNAKKAGQMTSHPPVSHSKTTASMQRNITISCWTPAATHAAK
eukprot:1138768-Pelagomonas_calceolata.AAC.3